MEDKQQTKKAFFLFQAPISPDSGALFCTKLEEALSTGCDEIILLLNSPGGSLRLALGILHFLEMLPITITTYNLSSCDSAAVLLFLAGKRRICTPDARFWLHSVYSESPVVHTEEELIIEMNCLKQDNEAVISAIASRTNGDKEQWTTAMLKKSFISAQEAQSLGLLHSIEQIKCPKSSKVYMII